MTGHMEGLEHYKGVPADEVEPPRRRHECFPWSYGPVDGVWLCWCPCGAVQLWGEWVGRNSRRGRPWWRR